MTTAIDRVEQAAARWSRQLVDESGRNQLVNFRDGQGILQLLPSSDDGTDETVLERLIDGRTVRFSKLMPGPTRAPAQRVLQRIHRRSRDNREEKGIDTLFLAVGLVSWPVERNRRIRAPFALLPLQLSPRDAARHDYNLVLSGDPVLNPVLAQMVQANFNADTESVSQSLSETRCPRSRLDEIRSNLTEAWSDIPGLQTEPMVAVGNFAYAAMPMVADLTRSAPQLAQNDIVAAMAGDDAARERLASSFRPVEHPDLRPVADEYLVLDADGSQQEAIDRALAGQSLVVIGPPGTGKSQVIANIIATLAAAGRTSLFVAEKRAAIEAVTDRLERVGLSDLVMDIHGGIRSRRQFAGQLHDALRRPRATPEVNATDLHRRLESVRDELHRHHDRRHRAQEELGLTLDELNRRMFDLGQGIQWHDNMGWSNASDVSREQLLELLELVTEWAELGREDGTVELSWKSIRSKNQPQSVEAADLVHELHARLLPEAAGAITGLLGNISCPAVLPRKVSEWQRVLFFLGDVLTLRQRYGAKVYRLDHSAYLQDLGGDTFVLLRPFRSGRRRALAEMRSLVRDTTALNAGTAIADLRRATAHVRVWPQLADDVDPDLTMLERGIAQAQSRLDDLRNGLSLLSARAGKPDFTDWDTGTLADALAGLDRNRHLAASAPRLHELEEAFSACGLDAVLNNLPNNSTPETATLVAERAWLAGVWRAELWSESETSLFRGPGQDRRQREFAHLDREHLSVNGRRIQRAVAEHAVEAMDRWPLETAMLERESVKKTRHRSMRALMSEASEVLTALWPCWAMSPLLAAELLPARPDLFDVVIMDEASQVLPASAVGALARGKQAIVAGDHRQLPPTIFFTATTDEANEDEDEDGGVAFMESILDVLRAGILPEVMLNWHYRSADSRLIDFSNERLYGGSLTVFPGSAGASPLALDVVEGVRGQGTTRSHPDEVDRVVDLVMEHARCRPDLSLGVIAFGIHHAEQIDHALRERLGTTRDSGMTVFFSDDRDEPFFVKNIERVQGDERDHIILSVGYHKGADGRLLHRFGPLNQDGGERRLNVAVSRSRRAMTVVSSITHHDFDPERAQAEGADLLRRFLEYAASGGNRSESANDNTAGLDNDFARRLSRHGATVHVGYGRGLGRIDAAVAHPTTPDRMVLAIDTDGPSYGATTTVRERERLRPQVLSDKGWRVHRIWSEQWLRDPEGEVARALDAWRDATLETGNSQDDEREPRSMPAMTDTAPATQRQGLPPRARGAIDRYEPSELREMARWIASDGQLRTETQLAEELRIQLGFRRRGRRIDAAVLQAVQQLKSDA